MPLQVRLALAAILNCRMDHALTVIAMVCGSFVTVSQGTHQRAPFDPLGRTSVFFVELGNLLASRFLGLAFISACDTAMLVQFNSNLFFVWPISKFLHILYRPSLPRVCALILVITAMNGGWLLEQPRSSQLIWHPRVRWLFRTLPKVSNLQIRTMVYLLFFTLWCSCQTLVNLFVLSNDVTKVIHVFFTTGNASS